MTVSFQWGYRKGTRTKGAYLFFGVVCMTYDYRKGQHRMSASVEHARSDLQEFENQVRAAVVSPSLCW
jgi:hypothetical protein